MVKEQAELRNIILKVIKYLKKQIELDYVILFGSYAGGVPHEFSDIDLGVVSTDLDNKSLEEKAQLFSEIKLNCDIDVEVHFFSLKELDNARPTNFLGHILESGLIYVKDKELVA